MPVFLRDETVMAVRTASVRGKIAIVTGATGGLGFETALGLARAGATTVIAARNPAKAESAINRIRCECPQADLAYEHLDLASLASVHRFADAVVAAYPSVDILVNNAAVMGLPQRQLTEDGFERQIGVNYIGHFALVLRLLPALRAAPAGARVVSVASLAHRRAHLDLDDLQSERAYHPMRAYGRSKLAMLMFAIAFQHLLDRSGWPIASIAAHPGWSRTDIIPNGIGNGAPGVKAAVIRFLFDMAAQPAREGALPLLYAAIAPQAMGGGYYGPIGWGETRGAPGSARIFSQAADPGVARRLWALSEDLTGQRFTGASV